MADIEDCIDLVDENYREEVSATKPPRLETMQKPICASRRKSLRLITE